MRSWLVGVKGRSAPSPAPMGDSGPMEPTGERTVPGIDRERYFFARHLAVYRWIAETWSSTIAGARIVDAGCGEGYGMPVLAGTGARLVLGLEYDDATCRHACRTYPTASVARANLAALPLRPGSLDLVVCLQVIEHLWDLPGFLRSIRSALRPDGALIASTPNREVFSPGLGRGQKPVNPFHVEEFDADQLVHLLSTAGWVETTVFGLHHGPRIQAWEIEHGSLVAAQVEAMGAGAWPTELTDFVCELTEDDFCIDGRTDAAEDLIVVGRPSSPPPSSDPRS